MSRALVFVNSSHECGVLGEMATLDLAFIEHDFLGDVRRPLLPVRVVAIQMDGQDGPRTNIRAAPPKASASHKFQANMEIRVFHAVSPLQLSGDPPLRGS
jgi:hypothetical protein